MTGAYSLGASARFGSTVGVPTSFESACRATYQHQADDDNDPTVMEYVEIQKTNGVQPVAMKTARATVGHEREQWRLAMQTEVDSLRENCTYEIATADEIRSINYRNILPMKMVMGVKADADAGTSRRKARVVVCGNFQPKSAVEELYTASADITSVRAALAAAVPFPVELEGR